MNAEAAVLGACLCSPQAYWRIADLLVPTDFASGQHAALFGLIVQRAREGSAFDAVTILEVSPKLGQLALELGNSDGWRTGNIRAYAEFVSKAAVERRVHGVGREIATLSSDDVLGDAQRLLGACVPLGVSGVKHIREFLRESVTEMQRRVDQPDALTGIVTGLPELDEMTGGWQAEDLIVIAARPSVGKTAFALQAAIAAARGGKKALFFSLEMSGVQLADRVQAHVAGVNAKGIRRPSLLEDVDFSRLFNAASEIAELPLKIDQTTGLTVEALCARARQVHAEESISIVFIDYLTQMVLPKSNSTADAIQIITRSLKGLGRELKVPVVLLSQLNREGEGHRPNMRHLRDSGAIEQDADLIIFLHRPDEKDRGHVTLIIEKQRNGETGDLYLEANMAHMRFKVVSPPDEPKREAKGMKGYGQRAKTGWQGYED
jgi:replicative DNA helicase